MRYILRCRGKKVAPFPTIVISRYTEEVLFYVLFAFNCMSKLACENIRFSSLLATGDVSFFLGETSAAAKSEEKRMFSQAMSKRDKRRG